MKLINKRNPEAKKKGHDFVIASAIRKSKLRRENFLIRKKP